MVEPPPELIPRRRRRSRAPLRRRLLALAILVAAAVGAVVAVTEAIHRRSGPTAPSTASSLAPPKPLRIVFPEGFTRREMAERIAVVDAIARRERGREPLLSPAVYLRLTASSPLPGTFARDGRPRPLEGFLFPATYDFLWTTPTARLVQMQVDAFRRSWATLDLRYARTRNLTPYDVLIIASLIEKEVSVPAERPLVAAVIYNRLRAGMPLGIDASIRYALRVPPTQSLRQAQLDAKTPYNTRLKRGLPPTPIANPGLAAMRAAAHPAAVAYLYYVREPDKRHHYFTASYRDFLRYEQQHGYGPGR